MFPRKAALDCGKFVSVSDVLISGCIRLLTVVITAGDQNVAQVPSFIVSVWVLLHCWLCRSFRISEVLSILSAFSYHCFELDDTKITCPSR